jgi:two-component system, cell cycle sensor histidine kinase and response regulator CckA
VRYLNQAALSLLEIPASLGPDTHCYDLLSPCLPTCHDFCPFDKAGSSRGEIHCQGHRIATPAGRKFQATIDAFSLGDHPPDGLLIALCFQQIESVPLPCPPTASTREHDSTVRVFLPDFPDETQALFEAYPEGVFIETLDGRILDANPAAAKMHGYSRTTLIGKHVRDLIPTELHPRLPDIITQELETGGVFTTAAGLHQNGTIFPTMVSTSLIRVRGEIRVLVVVRDMSERTRTEQEIQRVGRLASVSRLAGGVAHSLNNTLTALLGNLSLAKIVPETNPETIGLLEECERALKRGSELASLLIGLTPKPLAEKRLLRLQEILPKILAPQQESAFGRLQMTLAPTLPSVRVDANQFQEAIGHLFRLIRQRMPSGETLTIFAEPCQTSALPAGWPLEPGFYVRLSMSFPDPDWNQNTLDILFEPYSPMISNLRHDEAALGPCSAFAAIRRQGGHLTAHTDDSGRTTLEIYLQTTEWANADPGTDCSSTSPPSSASHPGKSVLILEDDVSVAMTLQMVLQYLGYESRVAVTGEALIEAYQKLVAENTPPDVLLIDLTIPTGLGGREALDQIKRLHPNVRAIASSGLTEDPVVLNPQHFGFISAIAKPYSLERLSEVLTKSLSASPLEPL